MKYTREVAACHYVCVNAFALVFIRQTFGIWKPARGALKHIVCIPLCAFVCTQICGVEVVKCIKSLPGTLCGEAGGLFQDKARLRSAC